MKVGETKVIYTAPIYKRVYWQLRRFAPALVFGLIVGFFIWLPNEITVTIVTNDKIKTDSTRNSAAMLGFSETVKIKNIAPPEKPKPAQPYVLSTFVPQTDKDTATVAYVKRFAKVAQVEQQKYGQPASVKLAQGLLESDRGRSYLARKHNNHFGVKCFSRSCTAGHCVNLNDDTHKDFFRKYENAWTSYRAHSLFLQKDRYKPCRAKSDWQGWCDCLQEQGYATSKKYAQTLKDIIRRYKLYEFD